MTEFKINNFEISFSMMNRNYGVKLNTIFKIILKLIRNLE